MSPLLEVRNLQVQYGGITAVRDLSFQVQAGEILVLIGANGAGKSSILRALSGIVPSGGRVFFDGTELTGMAAHRRVALGLAQVPEGRGIFGNLTVDENLRMGAWTLPPGEIQSTRKRVLSLFPRLEERLDQPSGTLSGGEQQMLAVARALLCKPKLLLLDEPSMGLAPKLVESLFGMLGDFQREGLTLLVVEQNAALALEVASRACVLEAGEVRLEGTPAEIRDHPALLEAYLGA